MGNRYALIVAEHAPDDLKQLVFAEAGLERAGESSRCTVRLPGKLFPGTVLEVRECSWFALVLPAEVIWSIGRDLAQISENCRGALIGVCVDDVSGEVWYQRFGGGDLVACHLSCDGITKQHQGAPAYLGEWTDRDVFGLLPDWLQLDALGGVALRGDQVPYHRALKETPRDNPWWKFW